MSDYPNNKLHDELKAVVSWWEFDGGGSLEDLTEAIVRYIVRTYGPPF